MRRRFLVNAAMSSAAAILASGCGSFDICKPTEVHLTSRSGDTATYQVFVGATSCEVIVPGATGFGVDTPESFSCALDGGDLFVVHRDPDRPDCTPDRVDDDGVQMGNCWDGAPMTILLWQGPRGRDETLALTLSGPTERTIEVPQTGCNRDPMEIDLSEGN